MTKAKIAKTNRQQSPTAGRKLSELSDKEKEEYLQRMVDNIDRSRFWAKVVQAAAPEMEAYRRAQAKSKAAACCTVFY